MTRIGTRMGRPEKSDARANSPKKDCIFPVGADPSPRKDAECAKKANAYDEDLHPRGCRRKEMPQV